ILDQYPSRSFVEEAEGQDGLQIPLDLRGIVRVARPRLDPVKNVFFAEAPIARDVYRLDQSWRLLGWHRGGGGKQKCGSDNGAQKHKAQGAERWHKCDSL